MEVTAVLERREEDEWADSGNAVEQALQGGVGAAKEEARQNTGVELEQLQKRAVLEIQQT